MGGSPVPGWLMCHPGLALRSSRRLSYKQDDVSHFCRLINEWIHPHNLSMAAIHGEYGQAPIHPIKEPS
jgi:hypothetical protein